MDSRFLLVQAGEKHVGLAMDPLIEVIDMVVPFAVPSTAPALRGVIPVRGRLVPVFHLGAALDGGGCPSALGEMAVVATLDGRRICLEVDHAVEVTTDAVRPLPDDHDMPGAVGVVQRDGLFIPIIDLVALAPTIIERGMAS